MRHPKPEADGYVPLEWAGQSKLTAEEQAAVESQRRQLWRHGIRQEPMLTRMAFEFGYALTAMRHAAEKKKKKTAS